MTKQTVTFVIALSALGTLLSSGCTQDSDGGDEGTASNADAPSQPNDSNESLPDDEPWSSPPGMTGELTLEHDGESRRYYLHVPENIPRGAPLVIVMHGYTGSAEGIMRYSGMNDVADEHGFVVAYPEGMRDASGYRFFNVGYDFHTGADARVDDVGFLRALVASLQESYSLSQTDVFSTGMSNGGDMSYLLACEASDLFKAIAPVAGMIMQSILDACSPQNVLPVFEIHGTDDDVTYWDGDMNNEDGWGAYPDMRTLIDFWVDLNELEISETTELENSNTNDGSNIIFERYSSALSENEVWFYKVMGGGHDWPGAFGNMDIDSSTEIWKFFSKYTEE